MGMQVDDRTDETLTFSFSSEAPVERFFGREILVHEKGAMDLSRLNDGAPWLWNHERGVVLGVVEKAWLGDDRRLYSTVRWSPNTTERGTEEYRRRNDIEAGITKNVSFAYSIDDIDERDGDFYVTKWKALEVSSVSVPADQSVGLGRAMDEPSAVDTANPDPELETIKAAVAETIGESLYSLKTEQHAERAETTDETPMTTEVNVAEVQSEARLAERDRVATIRGMCDQFQLSDLAETLINDDSSIDAAREVVMNQLGMRKVQFEGKVHDAGAAELGLSKREVKRFSMCRLLNHMMDPSSFKSASEAGFELEVTRAAADLQARTLNKSARGHLIPWEVLSSANRAAETPGQSVGIFADGGALVGSNRLDAQFIDLIRNRSAFLNSGLTMLTGLEGNVEISKKLGSSQFYFVGENVDVTNSKLAFGLVNMIPRTIGVRVPISRRAMIQASPDIENLVRLDMAESVALGMDSNIGYGTGSNGQPLGIMNTTGIGSVTLGGGSSKAFPANVGGGTHDCGDWADYVDLETALSANNLDAGAMRYIMNSTVKGALKQTLRASAAGSDYIMTDAGEVNGYPVVVSNQMQQNDVLFGNFADCVVGMWSGLDLLIDPLTQSASGQVILTVHQDFDVAVRRPQSFALGT
jgi:HK97 family phage major capsid protein